MQGRLRRWIFCCGERMIACMTSVAQATEAMVPSRLRPWGVAVLLMVAYVVLDRVGHLFPLQNLDITPWNPTAGLSVFILLRYGNIYAIPICAIRIVSDILLRNQLDSLPVFLVGAVVSVAGYVLIAAVLRKVVDLDVEAPTLNKIGAFIVAVLFVTALTSLVYVTALLALGAIGRGVLLASWLRRYVGGVSGIIMVLALILSFAPRLRRPGWSIFRFSPTAVAQGLALVALVAILFGIESIDESKFFYVLFLPIVWIAVQGGFSAAAAGVLWTQVVMIVAMRFTGMYTGSEVMELQILMVTLAVTGLMLGTLVSERRAAELELVETQMELNEVGRRAASGELASTIAHELNQPLTAVVYYARSAQLMRQGQGDPAQLDEMLSKASTQANRAAEIVRRLRNFIGHGVHAPSVFSIDDLVAEVLKLTTPMTKAEGITVRTALEADLHWVYADRVQIFQVLDNLVRNAIDAMAAGGRRPRLLTVSSASDDLGEISVRVADSGPGVPPDMVERMFQPFVTSKKAGMGLGLAICRTIVGAHEGRLWYEPAEEGGAAFVFTLRAHIDADEPG
jgi:signal transduction histidine kinase